MKLVRLSAYLFVENNKFAEFEKEFKDLVNKYSEDELDHNYRFDVNHVYELDSDKEPRKYKPGQIYKIKANGFLQMYLIIWTVGQNTVIGSFASIDTLNEIKKSRNGKFETRIEPALKFMHLDDKDNLMYDMGFRQGRVGCLGDYQPIDDYLEFYQNLDERIVKNVSAIIYNKRI